MHRPKTSRATHPLLSLPDRQKLTIIAIVLTASVILSISQATDSHAFFEEHSSVTNGATSRGVENSQTIVLLQAARNIDPTPARGGGGIIISNDTALVSDTNPFRDEVGGEVARIASDQISLYVVREGDTLSQVATMFNVSVSTIVWANQLSSSKDIHPGQTLLVLPVSGVQYTVRTGDTARGVATQFGGDIDEIIAYNNLPADGTLTSGSVITIPGGEAPAEKPKATTKKATTAQGTVASDHSGYYTHPVPGSIRTQGMHGYNGIDFGAPAGTPIRAAASGVVIVSRQGGGWNGGYGNYVVIDHPNGTQTLYAHNTSNTVAEGAHVTQGQVVGYVGSTGHSTGNHLHFEVRGAKNPFGN